MKILIGLIIGLVAAPILFAVAAVAGLLPSDAASQPPKWDSSTGMKAIDASLEKRSAGLKNPLAASDSAAMAAGAKIYADNCAGCHGDGKGPNNWGANGFYPRVPQFFQEGSDVTPTEAYAAIHDGVRYSGMPAWRGQLKEDEMWKVANFVANIRAPGGKKMDMD